MIRRALSRVAKSWAGVLLALLVWGGVAPRDASAAGCLAHLLRGGNPLDLGAYHPDQLAVLDLAETGSEHTPSPAAPAPCKGALCSGSPATPTSPAPSLLGSHGGKWALSQGPLAPVPLESFGWFSPENRLILPSNPSSVFHPPRHLPA